MGTRMASPPEGGACDPGDLNTERPMKLRTAEDILAIEAKGFDAFVPQASAWGILRHQAAARPDAVALEFLRDCDDPSRDERLTFAQLADRIEAAGRVFQQAGVGPGQAVAVLTQHTLSGQIALWGAQLVGRACKEGPQLRLPALPMARWGGTPRVRLRGGY